MSGQTSSLSVAETWSPGAGLGRAVWSLDRVLSSHGCRRLSCDLSAKFSYDSCILNVLKTL